MIPLRTPLVLALSLLALASFAPLAAADPPPGYGRCEFRYDYVTVNDPDGGNVAELKVPTGIECWW